MEKVVLLVERTGEQLRCLLNPEQLELKRQAGVVPRHSHTGAMIGVGLTDDPMLFCGGGRTELNLDLLFDIHLAGQGRAATAAEDVRDLTQPIWSLAENQTPINRYGRPPAMRLLWGASWNIRGVVTAVSERLERFDGRGRASRSWLRLRVLRIPDETRTESTEPMAPPITREEARRRLDSAPAATHEVVGGNQGERVDQIAADRLGHPGFWTLLADINGMNNPLQDMDGALQVSASPLVSGSGDRR